MEVVVSGATVLKAALIVLGVFVVVVASEVLLSVGLAVVFALGLDPLVTRLARLGIGRGKASLLAFLLPFVIVAAPWSLSPARSSA